MRNKAGGSERLADLLSRPCPRPKQPYEPGLPPLNPEVALQVDADYLEVVFRVLPDPVLLTALPEAVVIKASQGFNRLMGYKDREVEGRCINDVDPWVNPKERIAFRTALLRKGRCRQMEADFYSNNGRIMPTLVSSRLLRCEDKYCVLTIITDNSGRKQAEHDLKVSEERYARAVRLGRVGLWEWHQQEDRVTTEPFFGHLMGYQDSDLPRERLGITELIHPDDRKRVARLVEAHLSGETDYFESEHRMLHADGSVRWVMMRAQQMPADHAEGGGLEGMFFDITDRKEAEEKLDQTQKHLRSLMEAAENFGVYRLETDPRSSNGLRVVVVSPSISKLLGIREPNNFDTWFDSVHPDDLPSVVQAHRRAFDAGRFDVEMRIILPDDEEKHWIHAISTGVYDSQGELSFINGIIIDITDRKQAEEALVVHQGKLRALAQELSRVEERQRQRIAMDLHDGVGQLLAAAKIKVQTLAAYGAAPEMAEPLNDIRLLMEQAITQARSLTVELSPPVLQELGLEAAVEWLCEEMLTEHDMAITLRCTQRAVGLSDEVRDMLFRAVRELCHNVIKHAQASELYIDITHDQETLVIAVTDDGVGMAEGQADIHHGPDAHFGLFSIRERLEHLGGGLHLESAPGRGTTATLTAPLTAFRDRNGK